MFSKHFVVIDALNKNALNPLACNANSQILKVGHPVVLHLRRAQSYPKILDWEENAWQVQTLKIIYMECQLRRKEF